MSVSIYVNGKEFMNMANMNHAALFRLLGRDAPNCGAWTKRELPMMRDRLRELVASPAERQQGTRETVEIGTPGSARLIVCGIDDDYVRLRCEQLLEAVEHAIRFSHELYWS